VNDIDRAVRLLLAGELVALPTETVYGLGADAENSDAVARIFRAKGRPADHPLIVHLPGDQHLERWARDIPDLAWELAEQFWPGPLTLILKKQPRVPDAVTGGQDTVGLRVPAHPLALEVLAAFHAAGGSGGIAAPSANRFGRISPTSAQHVRDDLGDVVPLILDGGPCEVGIESTIVDLSRGDPQILRPGMIGPEALGVVLCHGPAPDDRPAPRVSGALEAHYAPRTPLRLVDPADLERELARASQQRLAVLSRNRPEGLPASNWIAAKETALSFGHDLYANLRRLDAMGVGLLLVERPPETPAWAAIHDRLGRAATGSGGSR
jgi:L-threonylcarbamoyladenylate synthase